MYMFHVICACSVHSTVFVDTNTVVWKCPYMTEPLTIWDGHNCEKDSCQEIFDGGVYSRILILIFSLIFSFPVT